MLAELGMIHSTIFSYKLKIIQKIQKDPFPIMLHHVYFIQ